MFGLESATFNFVQHEMVLKLELKKEKLIGYVLCKF